MREVVFCMKGGVPWNAILLDLMDGEDSVGVVGENMGSTLEYAPCWISEASWNLVHATKSESLMSRTSYGGDRGEMC